VTHAADRLDETVARHELRHGNLTDERSTI
jgi:hypothetical protein